MNQQKNSSKHYGHQACPSCPSHDAFFVYKDGHGHCYSCGYHDSGTRTIASMKNKLTPQDLVVSVPNLKTSNYTYDLPKVAIKWLKQYDISDKEIVRYGLMWNKEGESLVFPLFSPNGAIFATNERYFGEKINHPKYLTKGNKTQYPCITFNGGPIIFVEDFVSAIKVGRQQSSAPLLGTTIPLNWYPYLNNIYPRFFIWLDPDKRQASIYEVCRGNQYFIFPCYSIFSDKDPKCYSDSEIKELIEKSNEYIY